MNSIRIHPRLRLWFSRFGSLLLLAQRSPIIQLIFPEAKLLGGAAIADTATLAIATVVGLGAFDSVSGASSITQIAPSPVVNPIAATVGTSLTFTFQYTESVGSWQLVNTVGTTTPPASIPPGLTLQAPNGAKGTLSGIPSTAGSYSFRIKAWRGPGFTSNFYLSASTYTINVAAATPPTAPAITVNPSGSTINSGGTATLNVTATGTAPLTYTWYQGAAGVTTTQVQTGTTSSFTTPALTTTTSYWVKVSNAASSTASSTAATVTVRNPYEAWMFATGTGVPANLIGPMNIAQGDGVTNLLKFAFNLNPNIHDIRRLTVGSNNNPGLPGTTLIAGNKLRIEFIRRKSTTNPGITYTPQFCSNPSTWTDAAIINTPVSIDTTWERVVVDDPAPTGARRFGRVAVIQSP